MHIAVLLLRLLTSPSAANPTLCLSPADENTGDQAACHSSGKSMCVCMCAFIAVYGLSCGAQRISAVYTAELLCPIIRINCFHTTGNKCHNLLTFHTKRCQRIENSNLFTIKTLTDNQNPSDCKKLENLKWQMT